MNPDRRRRYRRAVFCREYPVSYLQPQYAVIGLDTLCAPGEIIKGPGWHIYEHATNKFGSFTCALHRILDAAFPFKHGPAGKAMLRQCREDPFEVNLSITWAAKTSWAIFPVLIATVDTRAG